MAPVMGPDPLRVALAGLARVTEAGSAVVRRTVLEHGAPAVWEALRTGRPVGEIGADTAAAAAARAVGLDPVDDLRAAADVGARLIHPGDDEWPSQRLDYPPTPKVEAAPLWLWVRGMHRLDEAVDRSVAVVGARAASTYGAHIAHEISFGLAERGWSVVSGGAYGIDVAAHKGSLASGAAPTVAVLANGVDVAYPRGNDRVLAQVARTGLVVSELPPGSRPTRRRFLVRNRLIAALSRGTLVVEAAARSGSLATVSRASYLGRPVMAVPGPVTSAMSRGCHELLRRDPDVRLVTGAVEVLEHVGPIGEYLADPAQGPTTVRDTLPDTVLAVLDAVPVRGGAGVAVLARDAGVAPLVVQQVLPPLLAHGLVERTSLGWRLTALGAGRGPAA